MGERLVIGVVFSRYHVIVVGVVEKYKMVGPRWYLGARDVSLLVIEAWLDKFDDNTL